MKNWELKRLIKLSKEKKVQLYKLINARKAFGCVETVELFISEVHHAVNSKTI